MAQSPSNAPGKRTERDRSRRVLSQNFLRDPAAIEQIVRAARPGPGDLVVEIGAGRGQLTPTLARQAGRVLAYEVDPSLAAALTAACAPLRNVTCLPRDFLAAPPPRQRFAVVGNIPYALTAPIVDWCLRAPRLTSATLVTQLEYARKRTGDFGRWSRLTVRTWPEFEWRLAGRIPRTAFRPVPRIESGILRLTRRPTALLPAASMPAYRRFVDLGFGGLGGSLHASLSGSYPARRVDAATRAVRLAVDTPVGYVWPEQWLTLFRLLQAPDLR
ncbi:ErmE/ErmH/ErmO/ErmR family 23S rRNA (adenine(2058)-N(6))-methyltransferase [Micromonospora sp. NPDC049679]|uniref:ErmE/ErmH/ErmO/ErmR family 23S rRNA (adenine(2058)-N(6))-methyltransferase n=1 Tax=Micromonospora sp. NPDC049679 TaxID=3155920 RepID=UPI0033DC9EB0